MKRFAILAAAIVLVVVAWSGAWFYFSGQIRSAIEAQGLADGVTSPRLACGTISITGFPFRFDIDCTAATLEAGDLLVSVAEVRASALVYRPFHIRAWLRGPAQLADAFTGARSELRWSDLEASLRLENDRLERLSVVAGGLGWYDTLLGETLLLSAPAAELHLLDMPETFDAEAGTGALAGYMRGEGIAAPGLGITDADLSTEVELTGLPADLALLGAPDALQRWQAAGGALRLVSLRGEDGDSFLIAEGEARLDAEGRVEGDVAIHSRGLVEHIAPLFPAPYGPLLLGNPADDGSYRQSISARGGVVMSGLLPAGTIAPLF